jgi:hypothetical protein
MFRSTQHRDERLLEAEVLRAVRRVARDDLAALPAPGEPGGDHPALRAAREGLAAAATLDQAIALEPLIEAARHACDVPVDPERRVRIGERMMARAALGGYDGVAAAARVTEPDDQRDRRRPALLSPEHFKGAVFHVESYGG